MLNKKIIIALDFDDLKTSEKIVKELIHYVDIFKIGLELFSKYGKDSIKMVQNYGGKVFLDLKFYDIPNTVKKAVEVITEYKIFMFNLHTLGGVEMMREARIAAEKRAKELKIKKPLILGITLLTSIDKKILDEELKIRKNIKNYVKHLAQLAKKSNLDGVVCSPLEIKSIRKEYGKNFLIVTPGIRLKEDQKFDQKRIMTPSDAIKQGADFIVMGRSITQSPNPKEKIKKIIGEIK